jgi:hypothetical protein
VDWVASELHPYSPVVAPRREAAYIVGCRARGARTGRAFTGSLVDDIVELRVGCYDEKCHSRTSRAIPAVVPTERHVPRRTPVPSGVVHGRE